MDLPTFDPNQVHPHPDHDYAASQAAAAQALRDAREHVEHEIREAMAYGFRESLGLVPFTMLCDDERVSRVRVECTFDRALLDALEDVRIRGKLVAAMREPNAERAQRMLRSAEAAIVDFHIGAHAPYLARMRAFNMRSVPL